MNTILSNIHTHSIYSDGKNTLRELCDSAVAKGFHTLGISDHSFTECDLSYCMKKEEKEKYLKEVNNLKKEYAGRLDIYCGTELDAFSDISFADGTDYFLGAVHYVEKDGKYYSVDSSNKERREAFVKAFNGDFREYCRSYYENVIKTVKRKPVYIAHFDLVTKFDAFDETDEVYRKTTLEAADVVIENGVPFEVNTGAMARGLKNTPYPSMFILEHIFEKGGKVILGSDCHYAEKLDFAFENAVEVVKHAGFKSILIFKNGKLEEQGI